METLKKEFKEVMYVGYETSMSPIVEREKRTMMYNVWWNKEDERGGFEILDDETYGDDYYAEGGLWFDGKELTDYDGVFELDENVVKCLKDWGADTSYVD